MLTTDTFPLPLNVGVQRVQIRFAPYDLAPLRNALQRKQFGIMQSELERMSASHVNLVSTRVLSFYLMECVPALYPNDCLQAMVPRIVAAIAIGEGPSVIAQFVYCALWRRWNEWADDERTVIRDFFNSLWCVRVKHSDVFGLQDVLDAAPLGLATEEILVWWESQTDAAAQVQVANLICRRMEALQARTSYWAHASPPFADAIVSMGKAVTEWLLSPRVQSNLEAIWTSDSLGSRSDEERVRMALEFLYSLGDVADRRTAEKNKLGES